MPEQGKAEQAPLHRGAKALDRDLRHHHCQPDKPDGDMQPVAADQREERGEEGAALGAGSDGDHAGELAELERQEGGAEREGDDGSQIAPSRRRDPTASDISPQV